MSDKIKITINGKEIEAVKDSYLLNSIQVLKIKIPTLCHHKDLTPNGSCRLCMCEVEDARGKKKMVTACNFPIRGEIKVSTTSEKVVRNKKMLAEMYLSRWPEVPTIKKIAKDCGVTATRFENEFTDTNPKACILCGRCTRACDEFTLERIIGFAGRGIKRHVSMPFNQTDRHCVGCSSCSFVCPTGAITMMDDRNHPVDPQKIRDHGMKFNGEMAQLDDDQCRMRQVGTGNIIDVMDQYDLLPCHNYKYGSLPEAKQIYSNVFRDNFWQQGVSDGCWQGCSMSCAKADSHFILRTGPYKGDKVCVEGPEYEMAGASSNMGCFTPEFVMEFNFYCDTYGIDTLSSGTCLAFVMECYEAGVITKEHTGDLDLKFGAETEAMEILHQMARGEGFGVDVGQGIRWLKEKWVREYGADEKFLQDIGMEVKGLEYSEYVPKESLAQQAGYAMANKGPQHDEAWLIFMDKVNNQIPTFEDKAEALYYFPLFRTWFGLFGLCKLLWNDVVPAENYLEKNANKIPGHVNNYHRYVEAMLGIKDMDDEKMLNQSARVYNLQRIMNRLMGFGTRKHDYPPYRGMGPVFADEWESRVEYYDAQLKDVVKVDPNGKSTEEKITILRKYREKQYDTLVDVVYKRRGWTKNGVPTLDRLKELGIDLPEIVEIVKADQE
jgi:aldehyde:ferredoxin oxidoreductase